MELHNSILKPCEMGLSHSEMAKTDKKQREKEVFSRSVGPFQIGNELGDPENPPTGSLASCNFPHPSRTRTPPRDTNEFYVRDTNEFYVRILS